MNILLEQTLHEEIPITKEMGIEVRYAELSKVVLSAPLSRNINHKSTAFGGSLNTVAVLACWSMLFVYLKEQNIRAHIVIQSSSVEYLAPVTEDFEATCHLPDAKAVDKMLQMFQRSGRGRIELDAVIHDKKKVAVRFHGVYVIHN